MNAGRIVQFAFAFITVFTPNALGSSTAVPRYRLEPIEALSGVSYSLVKGLNNSAEAVYSRISFGTRSYWWDNSDSIQLLPATASAQSVVFDINDEGTAVGLQLVAGSRREAVIWEKGVPRALGSLGGTESSAGAINDSGIVAGWSQTTTGAKHLFIWNGDFTDLGPIPSGSSCCYEINAINNAGQIVGHDSSSNLNGWVYSDGQITALPDLAGGIYSTPNDVSENGLVVGRSNVNQVGRRPVTWKDGQVSPLLFPSGATHGDAVAIGPDGYITGWVFFPDSGSGSSLKATLWTQEDLYYLKDLVVNLGDWNLQQSEAMNDKGQIIVYASLNGVPAHRVLLTPIPEPCSIQLLLLGSILLCGHCRCQRLRPRPAGVV